MTNDNLISSLPCIYLDYAATTPPDLRVINAMVTSMENHWGNVSSHHAIGYQGKESVNQALLTIANSLNVKVDEIIITSGATESINQAIKGVCYAQKKKHIITSTIEHKAVIQTVQALMKEGYHATFIAPNEEGIITPQMVEAEIREDTAIISLIWVNNETGDCIDVETIANIARARNIPFHVDATQAVPHVHIDATQFDLLSMSGHKCYGPKGVGLLYRRHFPRLPLTPLIDGSGGQLGIRSGTMPNELVVGLATALKLCETEQEDEARRYADFSQYLLAELAELGVERNGATAHKIDSTLNIYIPGVHADSLMALTPQLCLAKGSACNSDDTLPSYVLTELGYENRRALQSIRISFGRTTTWAEIKEATKQLQEAIRHLQNIARGIPSQYKLSETLTDKTSIILAAPDLVHASVDATQDNGVDRVIEKNISKPHLEIEIKLLVVTGIISEVTIKAMGVPYLLSALATLANYLRGCQIECLRNLSLETLLDNNIPADYLRDILLIEKMLTVEA